MTDGPGPAVDTWPFFAPSHADAIDAALDLAGVESGIGVVDLGCGDGQILLAAARRGAVVVGIEADADLAEEARDNLRAAGVDGEVRLGDLFSSDVDLTVPGVDEVVFVAYLAPATLQRLLPTLDADRRQRLVTIDFDVPGLIPAKRWGPARLYRLPGRRRPVDEPGWSTAGTLVAVTPGCQSLSCLEVVHPAGLTRVRLSRAMQGLASVLSGADALDEAAHLAIDLRWEEPDDGLITLGAVRTAALPDHVLVVCVTEDDDGMWDLTAGGVDGIRRALRRRAAPTTLSQLLDAANEWTDGV